MPDTVVIVNPASGGGSTGEKIDQLRGQIDQINLGEVKFLVTGRANEATKLTKLALRKNASRIIAIGGDGTANEVVNGFFETNDGAANKISKVSPKALMAFVPSGTRNVVAKSFLLPKGIGANLKRAKRSARIVDVVLATVKRKTGQTVSRVFLNAAEIGLGAHIIDRSRNIRKVVNSRAISTVATMISTVPTYRSNECEISIDGGAWQLFSHITICMVSNGAYLGGGFKMAPRADTSDGLLDLTIVKDSGSFKLLTQLLNMKTGEFSNDKNVIYMQSKKVAIRSKEREVQVTLDGEPAGLLPATFEVIPKALKFA